MIAKYQEYVEYEPNPKKNEVRLSDDLLLIAVEVLLQEIPDLLEGSIDHNIMSNEDENYPNFSQRILFSIGILEYGISRSPFNKAFKFKLMSLFEKIKNYSAVAKLYSQLEFREEEAETQSYIYFRMLIESPIHIKELQDVCKNILHYHKTAHYELVPYINRAYSRYSIDEVKSLFEKKVLIENSYFKTLSQFIVGHLGIFRVLHLSSQSYAKVLRENLALYNKMTILPEISEFTLTADLSPLYNIGFIKIKSIRDIKAKIPYTPESIKEDPFKHRKIQPETAYGLYLDNRYVHIHA